MDEILIPTSSKTRIPQGWSYPVGAELVSQTLQGITAYDFCYLRFLWSNPSSKLRSRDRARMPMLSVLYTNPKHTALERHWCIDVHGVRSEQKAAMKQLLVGEVLPYVRTWITAEKPPTWYEMWKHLFVAYNWDLERIEYQESGGA